ncbi:MAG: hypothetical protein HY778_10540 [Betaproteobacteria bacterium]|nr:hypothetical protein [Betaproteobacteria bacterium]
MDKESTRSLDKFVCPFGGQEVELLEVRYLAGGMPLLRLRIRERKRFTIFEIDAASAARWAQSMLAWSEVQGMAGESPQ